MLNFVSVALRVIVRVVVIVLERLTEPRIMRTRINRGSDEFFAWERKHAGETELDEVLDQRELRG
jgi:hypothetical protein